MVLLVVGGKLFLWQWQVTFYQTITVVFFTVIWLPLAYVSSSEDWITGSFAGFSTYAYFWGWTGLWPNVMRNPTFWLLCLLVPLTVLLPQMGQIVWKRAFHPEFRDLAMEAETWGLDMNELKKTPIPTALRRLPLVKRAPVNKEPRRLFT